MTTRQIALFLALLASLPASADQPEAPLGPDDFAYGRRIEVTTAAPLQTVPLDLAVYRGSVEPRLADLRVFNGAGEVVPHAIRPLMPSKEATGTRVAVPFFRLPGAAAPASTPPSASVVADGEHTYTINAEVSPNGSIVSITAQPAADAKVAPSLPAAYLLDTSQIKQTVVGLDLDLGENAVDFIVPLLVEASDDLVRFRPVATQSVLARLNQSGHRIERSDVEIVAGRYRYLRLSWPEEKLPVEIRAAEARLAPDDEIQIRDEVQIEAARVDGEPGALVFDLGGTVPVDQLQIDLPDANTVVEAQLSSAAAAEGPWTKHYSGLLFELDSVAALRNPAIGWPANRHRYVKLTTSTKGGGVGGGVPTLQASWYPEQLLFIRRGEPPYSMGYGRAGAPNSGFTAAELLQTAHTQADDVPRATASLGEQFTTAPPSVLKPSAQPIETRTMALWAVLIASVMVALTLSLRLLRQIRSQS